MAKMVPPALPAKAPFSEHRIFEALQKGHGTSDWYVLPRLRAQGENARYENSREVDFLIIIPSHGLFCLEVKGGAYDIIDGRWYRNHVDGNEAGSMPVAEPPDEQAEEAMDAVGNALRRAAEGRDKPFERVIRSLPLWYGVAFTTEQSLEEYNWDDGCLMICPPESSDRNVLPAQIVKHMDNHFPRRNGRSKNRGDRLTEPLSDNTIDFMLRVTRRKNESKTVLITKPDLDDINQKLIELTEEQAFQLYSAQNNDRVLLTGAAGTGKTMLALELARQWHDTDQKVAVICHSEMLGSWFRKQLTALLPSVGSLTQAMIGWHDRPNAKWTSYVKAYNRVVRGTLPQSGDVTVNRENLRQHLAQVDSIREIYIEFLLDALVRMNELHTEFDYLIVDELQYFNDPEEWQVLDSMLKGGLENGRWAMFADFNTQNWTATQYGEPNNDGNLSTWTRITDVEGHLLSYCRGTNSGRGWFSPPPLQINCRNSRKIAQEVAKRVGSQGIQIRHSQVDGPPVQFLDWSDDVELVERLTTVMEQLRRGDVGPNRIAVITDTKIETLRTKRFDDWTLRLMPGYTTRNPNEPGTIGLYPTEAFAGLESDVVILVVDGDPDLWSTSESPSQALQWLYVGMTRARGSLIVLARRSRSAVSGTEFLSLQPSDPL